MSKNLLHLLNHTHKQPEFRKSYLRDQRNTETSNPSLREKIVYLPTAESESNLHLNKSLLKSKSLENQSQCPLKRQSTLLRQQSDFHMPHTLPTVSQIVQREVMPVQPKQRNSYCQEPFRNSTLVKTSVLKVSGDFRKSTFLENEIL